MIVCNSIKIFTVNHQPGYENLLEKSIVPIDNQHCKKNKKIIYMKRDISEKKY
jgi:hypothetical protein